MEHSEIYIEPKGTTFKVWHKGGKETIEHTEKKMTSHDALKKVFKKFIF